MDKKSTSNSISSEFAMFHSREWAGSEFNQVQELLNIDLSILRLYPTNYEPDIDDLQYFELPNAKREENTRRINEIISEIEKKIEWEQNYNLINDGRK